GRSVTDRRSGRGADERVRESRSGIWIWASSAEWLVVAVALGQCLQVLQDPRRFFPLSHGLAMIQREKATMAKAMGSW
ncbi:MAG: hypothetical protein ACKN9U_01300, partial [Pirellulaceae bacterium]